MKTPVGREEKTFKKERSHLKSPQTPALNEKVMATTLQYEWGSRKLLPSASEERYLQRPKSEVAEFGMSRAVSSVSSTFFATFQIPAIKIGFEHVISLAAFQSAIKPREEAPANCIRRRTPEPSFEKPPFRVRLESKSEAELDLEVATNAGLTELAGPACCRKECPMNCLLVLANASAEFTHGVYIYME
jgi:hypothetical protein